MQASTASPVRLDGDDDDVADLEGDECGEETLSWAAKAGSTTSLASEPIVMEGEEGGRRTSLRP